MSAGDIAFKCNFAHMDDSSGIVLRRRVDRDFEKAGQRLCRDLDGRMLIATYCCNFSRAPMFETLLTCAQL